MNEKIEILESQLNALQKELDDIELKTECVYYCNLIKIERVNK